MKRERGISRNQMKAIVAANLLVLALIYVFLFDFSRRVDYQMRNMITEHLEDINSQSVKSIGAETDWMLDEVRFTADYISSIPEVTEEGKQRLYNQLKSQCDFSDVRLISADGNLYSQENELLPASNGGYVEQVCRGESGMTDVFISSVSGHEVFAFYAPVMKEGRPNGGIAGIMNVEQMVDMTVSTGFNSDCYAYLMKPDGTIIMQNMHKDSLYDGRDYFKFLVNETEVLGSSTEEVRQKMENRETGVFLFRKEDQRRIAYYAPAGINDWYVVTEVTYDVFNRYRERLNLTAVYLTIKIVVVFLIVAALIIYWFTRTRKIILDSKVELELEKKKLELALSHASYTTFEYVLKEDWLVFITPPEIKGSPFPPVITSASTKASAFGLVSDDYMEKWQEILGKVSKGEAPELLEFTGGTSFKEDTWFRLSMSLVKDSRNQVIEAIGTMEDISEEKRIKKRFAQEEQYRAALLSEAVIMWSVDLEKQQVIACSVNGTDWMNGRESFQYSDEFIRRISKYIHPEDYTRVTNMVQVNNMLAAYFTKKRELKELFRASYPDRNIYRWMTCRISLLTEPTSGTPAAFAYVSDVDEETRREIELSYSSERDPLTGLYNRRNVSDKVDMALKNGTDLCCLLMMDLDDFKGINDKYGHQEGDQVLKKMAKILTGAFRAEDLLARFGGDEFIVFLDHLHNKECAYSRAEEVCRKVYELTTEKDEIRVSISIGLAFGPEDGNSFSLLYEHADEALYIAKRRGKNQIAVFGDENK